MKSEQNLYVTQSLSYNNDNIIFCIGNLTFFDWKYPIFKNTDTKVNMTKCIVLAELYD